MTYVVEVLRQEHRNIERLLRVLEQELRVFDRGNRPDYEVVLGVIDYFKDYPIHATIQKRTSSSRSSSRVILLQRRTLAILKSSIRRERVGFDELLRRSSEY